MIEKILNSNKLLTEIYFDLQKYFETKYPNPIVLIEIGSFFEIYEANGIGKAKEIAEFLNIQLTRKNKSIIEITDRNPLMAGFPNHAIERYLSKLVDEEKYTIIIVKQKGIPPNVTRYVSDIISAGVNFEYAKSSENYVTSIIIERIKNIYHIGYANLDITTGKSNIYEAYSTKEDNTFALDELFKMIQTYKSKEFILTLDKSVECDEILKYLELKNRNIIYSSKRVKINYQNMLLKKVYKLETLLSPIEALNLENIPLATESLTILIEFIIAHNYKIIQKIDIPKIIENNKYLYFGNNPIEQLDLKDILKLIDQTTTTMGKRLIKQRIFNPIKDKKELNKRYKSIDFMLKEMDKFDLKEIYDIERLDRKIKLQKLHPFEINYLYSSLKNSFKVYNTLNKDTEKIEEFIFDINNSFDLEKSAKVMFQDIKESIFKKGYHKTIDNYLDKLKLYNENLKKIAERIESFFEGSVKVNINELDKEGHYLSLTKTRFSLIQDKFNESFVEIEGQNYFFKDFHIKKLTSQVKISGSIIDEISNNIILIRQKLVSLTKELFLEKLMEYEKNYTFLGEVATKIAEIDVALSGAKVAKKYGYSKPIIDDKKRLKIVALRHPLIEINQENGIYVPNDIDFSEYDGMLLYGINSSGKSSLMRSVGIAVILAQSGFFVPADKMEFKLYDTLFTRIVSKDNLQKGLSTFAVEMIELKNIFKRATSNSLILGDEISHGTETISALSIVASAIIRLAKLKSNFIFATHLHQLVSLEEINSLKNVVSKHLEVYFDEKTQKLIYNRKLQNGNGSSVYGLEFAKSLYMDSEFLKVANDIRKKVTNDYNELELLTKQKKSKYNKNLIITTCAICGKMAEDVHHIIEQSKTDNELIKNHKYNLIPLCKKHHQMVHNGRLIIKGFITTDKGIELHYDEI